MPQALGILLRQLADDPDFPDIIDAAIRDHPMFPCDLAAALWDAGRLDAAGEACALVLDETVSHVPALLATVEALSGRGYVELALRRLASLRRRGLSGVEVIAAVREHLLLAATTYEAHVAAGELVRAMAICDLLIDLCPAVELFRQTRDNVRVALARSEAGQLSGAPGEYHALNMLVTAAREQSELENELRYRLAIWRHPVDREQHSAVRVNNLTIALALVLSVDIDTFDADRLHLARDLLAALSAMPQTSRRSDGGDDTMIWWERAQRQLLGTINLDLIFGRATDPHPALPISFVDASGNDLDLPDIAARARAIAAGAVFFTSASPEYLARYGRTYVASVLQACDCSCLVVICVCTPRHLLAERIAMLGLSGFGIDATHLEDHRLIFCSDDFDPQHQPMTIYSPMDAEAVTVPGAYYASAALMRVDVLLRLLGLPVFVTGIDTVLQRGVLDLIEQFAGCDVVLNKSGPKSLLGSQLINNLVLAYPTPNAFLFVDFLKTYLGGHLSQPTQATFLDQLDLHMAKHHLMAYGEEPSVGYFGALDINNVMFNSSNYRAHAGTMRSFRFLNMFVGAFGDDERLTVEHVVSQAA